MTKIIEPREESTLDAILIAVCIPDACYPSDVFGQFGLDFACQTKNDRRSFNNGDIAFLYVVFKHFMRFL